MRSPLTARGWYPSPGGCRPRQSARPGDQPVLHLLIPWGLITPWRNSEQDHHPPAAGTGLRTRQGTAVSPRRLRRADQSGQGRARLRQRLAGVPGRPHGSYTWPPRAPGDPPGGSIAGDRVYVRHGNRRDPLTGPSKDPGGRQPARTQRPPAPPILRTSRKREDYMITFTGAVGTDDLTRDEVIAMHEDNVTAI